MLVQGHMEMRMESVVEQICKYVLKVFKEFDRENIIIENQIQSQVRTAPKIYYSATRNTYDGFLGIMIMDKMDISLLGILNRGNVLFLLKRNYV
jgi:hypothetical protein